VAYLIVPGSVLLFVLYLYVLNRWTATATNYGFVLIPLVTVLVASVIAGEIVSLTFLAGTALVLVGVYIGAISRTQRSS
jgi:O-acetylserine/cysteine efflux transporter